MAALALDGSPPIRCSALTLLGRLAARRGDPASAGEALADAWSLAVQVGESQRIGPAASAIAEAAALAGDPDAAGEVLETAYAIARRAGAPAVRAELSYWLGRLGRECPAEDPRNPYAQLAAGRWRQAAAMWRAAGMPYEEAAAVLHDPDGDTTALTQAVELSVKLGAEPLARQLRSALRARGVTRIARGPRPSTTAHPHGLTERQREVARWVADGLSNADIAARLVVSVRTVDSHVASVLAKLGLASRRELTSRRTDWDLGD